MKTLLTLAVMFGLSTSAFTQEGHFHISDDGEYYLADKGFSKKARNQTSLTVTTLTFYVAAKTTGLLHWSINYPDFAALTITEQQNLLYTLQGETERSQYSTSDIPAETYSEQLFTKNTLSTTPETNSDNGNN